MKYKWMQGVLVTLTFATLISGMAYAGPGDDDDDYPHPHDVTVNNWQTFRPRVTALRSLNAYLATDKNQQVYYVPTLEELPGVETAVSDCTDYSGKRQQFAAIYKGYFNQMCYEALVRKSDGTYSKVPAIVSSEGSQSVRELTTLGYDFLLTREAISNIQIDGENINADYTVGKIDAANGYVDLNTAIMDIYKAVGQEKYDITYAFSRDDNMTVENSPIQSEINLTLSKSNSIDASAGKGWVFATRTNPVLYWKQAAYDGVVFDTEALGYNTPTANSDRPDGNKTQEVTLAQFCAYAYNIMNIYGEPVMTQSEKNILLQLYGSVVPYKACSDAEVEAIETLIAKGIISPDDDQTYLNWNGRIKYDYMLTLLMRIKDVNARKTYKDVQITMDASMISNDYYNAQLTYTESSIQGFEAATSAARVTNYYDYYLDVADFRSMATSVNTREGIDLDFFIPTHLVVEGKDGTLFPLTTQVTPLTKKVYSADYPQVGYVLNQSAYDVARDGMLMQFCISNGISKGKLHLRVATFDVEDLVHSDEQYHLYLVDDSGNKSSSPFTITPGGGIYYASGVRDSADKEDDMVTDKTEDAEYTNTDEVEEVVECYDSKGQNAAEQLAAKLKKEHPEWSHIEIEAIDYAASDGDYLSPDSSYTYYMKITANSEQTIEVTTNAGDTIKLSDIMANTEMDGLHYVTPSDKTDLGFRRITPTLYQVENCTNKNDLFQRIKGVRQENYSAAYCKQDEELMVSTRWLKDSGFISVNPTVNDDLLMLSTAYSNIYLDKKNHFIVVGSTVYSVADLDNSEIWKEMGDGDIYINFRAVLGWTGDYMIFKNVGNTISVTVLDSNTVGGTENTITGRSAQDFAIPIYMADVGNNILGMPVNDGNKVYVQGYKSTRTSNRQTVIPMWSMYPFCNYFVYMNSHYIDNNADATYHDWLFVFKPKEIQVNGHSVVYDDTASRQLLHQVVNVNTDKLDAAISVWAYPLYRTPQTTPKGMPKEMSYSDQYGYIYTPQSPASLQDAIVNYMEPGNVMLNQGEPTYALPFYLDSNKQIKCINYNTFKYDNGTKTLDYGQMPSRYLIDPNWVVSIKERLRQLVDHAIYIPWLHSSTQPDFKSDATINYSDCQIFPTVTSPALWFLGLNEYDFDEVVASMGKGSQLYWGTMKVFMQGGKLYIGEDDVSDKLKNKKFMLMRETGSNTSVVGRWYSVSALTAFDMDPITDNGSGTTSILETPKDGVLGTTVDVIDWEEFRLTRILETCEFGIALLMIITLNVVPRIALFLFLLLVALGVIQNVKLVQIFCDRLFDPYKFLTCGRRDVHSFRPGRAFISSIIAMAVFALFMDGTIIHIYEWFMQMFAVLVGLH